MLEKLQKEQKEELEILKEKYNNLIEKNYLQKKKVLIFQKKLQKLKKKLQVKIVNIIN